MTVVQNQQNIDPTPRSSYQAQFTDPQVVQQEKQSQEAEKEVKDVETPVTEEK